MKEYAIFDSKSKIEIQIKVGQNALENWLLIDESKQNDIWFHIEGYPSPHVIIYVPPKSKISKQTIKYAASLCKSNSKFKGNNQVAIIYTQMKNISKGDQVGSVFLKKRTQKIII